MTKKLMCSLAFCLAATQALLADTHYGSKSDAEWQGYAGWIFMAPERAGLDFAVPAETNRGKISHVETEFDHGLRVGARKRLFGGAWDAGFHYLWLCADGAEERVTDSSGRLAGTRLALASAFTSAGDISSAHAAYENTLHMLDLEWGKGMYPCKDATCFRMYGGLKYVALCEEMSCEYTGDGPFESESEFELMIGTDTDRVWQRNRTQAYGTYLGFEGTYKIMKRVGLYGNASAGLLVGCVKRNLRQTGDSGFIQLMPNGDVDLRDTVHRMIANFNIDTGLVFALMDKLDLRLGWEYHCFLNNADFILLNQNAEGSRKHDLDRHGDSLGYSGLYLMLGASY